ncbi:hypothetical protein M153_7300011353, partial [Pseudoloma neurophilia]
LILSGSVIHTDPHASYNTTSSLGFSHSRELVARDCINTNWIGGLFGCLKRCSDGMMVDFMEFIIFTQSF